MRENFLVNHEKWLNESEGWKASDQACAVGERFSGDELKDAILRMSLFTNCSFRGCNMQGTDFSESIFINCDFSDADLSGSVFCSSQFLSCRFLNACIVGANFSQCRFSNCDFTGADLQDSIFYEVSGFEESSVKRSSSYHVDKDFDMVSGTDIVCVWKKVEKNLIVRLEIPEDAKRINVDNTRCKTNKAIVRAIENIDGTSAGVASAKSLHDPDFIYCIGETLIINNYHDDNSMSDGIYFFTQRTNAEKY